MTPWTFFREHRAEKPLSEQACDQRERASEQAAQNIASMKKQAMAEAAEAALAGKGWLPALLRTMPQA